MSKASPLPGHKVRGSTTGRPIMALLDQLGRRWTLRILWELRDNHLTFRELQQACGAASPSVLNSRLRELRELRLVIHTRRAGYGLSPLGRGLLEFFTPLQAWSDEWAKALEGATGRPD